MVSSGVFFLLNIFFSKKLVTDNLKLLTLYFNFGILFDRDIVLLKESGVSLKNKNIDVNMQSWNEEC